VGGTRRLRPPRATNALAAALFAAGLLYAPRCLAAPSARAVAAEELFDAGRELLSQGKFAEACEKLDASEKLDPAVGTLFSLGQCYEGLGRTASAWFAYRGAVALAAQRNDLRRATAEQSAAAIEPRLSTLVVHASDASPQSPVTITIDGEAFSHDALRAPIPIDPGTHTVAAAAPQYKPWSSIVLVHEPKEEVSVDVPPLQHVREVVTPSSTKPILGVASVSLGAVSLGVGTLLGLQAIVKGRDVDRSCPSGDSCGDGSAVHENNVARSFADASNVLLPVGALLVVAGAYLIVTSHSSAVPVVGTAVTPSGARFEARWSW
jgi:hypothetical protein